MKVVHINTTNSGGAAIAALRLHRALTHNGFKSAFISKSLTIDFDDRRITDPFFSYRKPSFIKKLISKIIPLKKTKLLQEFNTIKLNLNCEIATIPLSNYELHKHPLVQEADVINLHWISDFVDLPSFFQNISQPVVWTLHDKNPFKGIFHYNIDEVLNPNAREWSEYMLAIKRNALSYVKKGAIISPSNWLLNAASDSKLFSNFQIKDTISNCVPFAESNPAKKQNLCRLNLGLRMTDKILLYICNDLTTQRKGYLYLKNALENLNFEVILLTIGKGEVKIINDKIKVIPLGFLNSQQDISNVYFCSDLLMLPSLEDNLPNTMLEAFAHGLPVISFKNGGMIEHIQDYFNGLLVDENVPNALQKGIINFFRSESKFDKIKILEYAQNQFSQNMQATKYIEVYNKLLSKNS